MVDFSKLENLLRRVGGQKSRRQLKVPEREGPDEIFRQLRERGFAVVSAKDLSKVEVIKNGLLSIDGQQIILYIYQPYNHIESIRAGAGPKFHLVDCQTLQNMRSGGRYDRYVVHADPESNFPIRPHLDLKKDWGEEVNEDLLPCKNCLAYLNLDKSDAAVRSFDRVAFFEKFKSYFSVKPRYNRHTQPRGSYPPDWHRIRGKILEQANWTCAQCGVNCSDQRRLLHAHHKNGLPADCKPNNLQPLCAICHSQQPFHHLMHVNEEDRQAILAARQKQGISLDDSTRMHNTTYRRSKRKYYRSSYRPHIR